MPSGSTRTWRPNAGDDVVEEHSEQTLGHEEVYVVLTGRATFMLGDETLDAPAGTVVFIRDPAIRRHARAEEPGTSVLAVGGPRGKAYEPSPWEDYFAAERHRTAGNYDAYVAELVDALRRRPDIPRRSTTSPVPRRSRGVPTMPWRTSREPWSSTPSSASTRRRTRTSAPSASARTGRSNSA